MKSGTRRPAPACGFRAGAAVIAATPVFVLLCACKPSTTNDPPATTPLPTRQTTIDPVIQKLDAASQDAERRRADAERAGQ